MSSCSEDDTDHSDEDFDEIADGRSPPFLSRLAVFGDSGSSVVVSFVLLLVSIGAAVWLNVDQSASHPGYPKFTTYESLGKIPALAPPKIVEFDGTVTTEMRAEYERDGVICVRGLIDSVLLGKLDADSAILVDEQRVKDADKGRKQGNQFYTMSHSAVFRTNWTSPQTRDNPSALMEVALWSNVPAFAAALLFNQPFVRSTNSDEEVENVRLIRDIFLAKDDDKYVCGWHVDDLGFWPATPESPGINAWIALDDMEVTEETGGFALAVQSHKAPWREAAYYWTGASTNFPSGGYKNASDMFARRTGQGTCNLEKAAFHLHRRMEETARIYRVKKGDVIFHTRWLFHRTVAVNRMTTSHRVYRRYSLRYGPGSSVVPPGFGTELSVLWNSSNGGQAVDDICDVPWYPRAWPLMETKGDLDHFWGGLDRLISEILPIAEERRVQRIREMKPLLKRLAKKGVY